MQKDIHHWIHYIQPLGWGNQIKNDVALDYQVNYEKELLSWENYFSLASYTVARLQHLKHQSYSWSYWYAREFYLTLCFG